MIGKDLVTEIKGLITKGEKNQKTLKQLVYVSFAVISLAMSVLNIITQRDVLLLATSSFCVLCLADYLICTYGGEKGANISLYMFMVEITALFSYFIITGGTDNFSITWLLLLPTLGLFFFGRELGSVMCAIILLIMIGFFHIPALRSICTDYGTTFRIRFPIVYMCSYFVALGIETVRVLMAKELDALREKYAYLYIHDDLTKVYNRYGMQETFNNFKKSGKKDIAVMIFDIDFFKRINDTYGHLCGDVVLAEIAQLVLDVLPDDAVIHRWGGEEFAVVYFDRKKAIMNANLILEAVRNHVFILKDQKVSITVSLGLAISSDINNIDEFTGLLDHADNCLYMAKNSGRNKLVYKTIED